MDHIEILKVVRYRAGQEYEPHFDGMDFERYPLIVINERQLRRVIGSYVAYYPADRTHLGLEKDTPEERVVESREDGKAISIPRARAWRRVDSYDSTRGSAISWLATRMQSRSLDRLRLLARARVEGLASARAHRQLE